MVVFSDAVIENVVFSDVPVTVIFPNNVGRLSVVVIAS